MALWGINDCSQDSLGHDMCSKHMVWVPVSLSYFSRPGPIHKHWCVLCLQDWCPWRHRCKANAVFLAWPWVDTKVSWPQASPTIVSGIAFLIPSKWASAYANCVPFRVMHFLLLGSVYVATGYRKEHKDAIWHVPLNIPGKTEWTHRKGVWLLPVTWRLLKQKSLSGLHNLESDHGSGCDKAVNR